MLPLFYGAVEVRELRRDTEQPASEAGQTRTDIPVTAPLSFNLLLPLHDAVTGELVCASLVRLDTAACTVSAVTFPAMTVALWDREPMTLYAIHAQRGAAGVARALSDTLSVPVSGYLSLSGDRLSRFVDALGGFPYTLERAVTVTDLQGQTVYSREAGSLRLYGLDVAMLVTSGGYSGTDLLRLYERLWLAALECLCANEDTPDRLYTLVRDAVDEGAASDLGAELLSALTRAASYLCGDGCLPVNVRPEGVFRDNLFELSQGADEKLWGVFSKV